MTVEIRPLERTDDRTRFHSGDEALDLYFHRYAGQNQFRHHVGVTYVAVEGGEVVSFATVSPASLDADDLPDGRKRPPYPAPVLRIGRMAVSESHQGRGLGRVLLRFCLELALRMRNEFGCVGMAVDAKPGAVEFYRRYGFVVIEAAAGAARTHPPPRLMFLALESVPMRDPGSAT